MVNLSQIAIAYWLVSWLGVTTAYALSTVQGFVPLCVPFVTGCVSVSAVGRHGLGFVAFKATILPAAALGVLYWTFAVRWIGNVSLRQRGMDTTIVVAGVVGSGALGLYTIFLGLEGETYRLMRHYGVVAYFASTYLAQVLLTQRLRTGEFCSRSVKLKRLCVTQCSRPVRYSAPLPISSLTRTPGKTLQSGS